MDGDILPFGQPNLWRLSTVHRVEELKSILRLLPIWAVGLTTSLSQGSNFAIQQARIMDRHITQHFQILPATLSIFTVLSMLISLAIYDRIFVPFVRRFTKRPSGITYLQRMGVGLFIVLLASVSAALVERKRKSAMNSHGVRISVFWLVPQFAIHGIAQTFMSVGHMEFCYDQSPESMRSTATALYWFASSIGSYLGTALVSFVHNYTKKRGGDWLQDKLNKAKLDYYYWLATGFQVLSLGYYLLCVKYYTMKPLEVLEDEKDMKENQIEDEKDMKENQMVGTKEGVKLGSGNKIGGNSVEKI